MKSNRKVWSLLSVVLVFAMLMPASAVAAASVGCIELFYVVSRCNDVVSGAGLLIGRICRDGDGSVANTLIRCAPDCEREVSML